MILWYFYFSFVKLTAIKNKQYGHICFHFPLLSRCRRRKLHHDFIRHCGCFVQFCHADCNEKTSSARHKHVFTIQHYQQRVRSVQSAIMILRHCVCSVQFRRSSRPSWTTNSADFFYFPTLPTASHGRFSMTLAGEQNANGFENQGLQYFMNMSRQNWWRGWKRNPFKRAKNIIIHRI